MPPHNTYFIRNQTLTDFFSVAKGIKIVLKDFCLLCYVPEFKEPVLELIVMYKRVE